MGKPKGKLRFGQRHKVLKSYAARQSAKARQELTSSLSFAQLGKRTSLKIVKKRYAIIARDVLNALGVKNLQKKLQVHRILSKLNANEVFEIIQKPGWHLRLPIAQRLEKVLGRDMAEKFGKKFQELRDELILMDARDFFHAEFGVDERLAESARQVYRAMLESARKKRIRELSETSRQKKFKGN